MCIKTRKAAMFSSKFLEQSNKLIKEDVAKWVKLYIELFNKLSVEGIEIILPFNFTKPFYKFNRNDYLFEFEMERNLDNVPYCFELTNLDSKELAALFSNVKDIYLYKGQYYKLDFDYSIPNRETCLNPRLIKINPPIELEKL